MIPLILILAGLITAVLVKRPDARAATMGGLRAGAAQADIEFRRGFTAARTHYDQAQKYLTRPTASGDPPGPRNLRWWASALGAVVGGTTAAVAGGTYGLLKVLGGAVRIGRQAAEGARQAYRDYKAIHEIEEAEVIEEIEDAEDTKPAPEQAAPAEEPKDRPATDLTRYDTPHERTTVNAEFTSFPQLRHDHETANTDMTEVAAAIDGQVAGLLAKNMGRGALITALMAAQETATQLAAQHARIAELAAAQGTVAEAHAAVGGVDNVADKGAYAEG
ncbi:hypothetical protein HNP84_009784 [Thermocatellispora tengchongensis]|uniref:Uncharacterized protein n=1 Tax=Thermocatellispora tengchongensis TaxID=1073253 RepID=A0A840PM41_9ACTN|nr:hypothetical protein [Thermocatellispora tengchongensis]MBB5140019.1 hypothetical protein [Thermocatellispora tengchongensis]